MNLDGADELRLWEARKQNTINLINAHETDIRAGAINGPDQLRLLKNTISQLRKEVRSIDATIASIKKQHSRQTIARTA